MVAESGGGGGGRATGSKGASAPRTGNTARAPKRYAKGSLWSPTGAAPGRFAPGGGGGGGGGGGKAADEPTAEELEKQRIAAEKEAERQRRQAEADRRAAIREAYEREQTRKLAKENSQQRLVAPGGGGGDWAQRISDQIGQRTALDRVREMLDDEDGLSLAVLQRLRAQADAADGGESLVRRLDRLIAARQGE